MARPPVPRTVFLCRSCGARSLKWAGRCGACGEWGSLEETRAEPSTGRRHPSQGAGPQELSRVSTADSPRLVLPFTEVNHTLGGGIVPGSLLLIGGDPGIGKSTLLLQMADAVARDKGAVLYVSGEESAQQVRLRAQRLGIQGDRLFVFTETDLDAVLHELDTRSPALAIVDSIQTVYLEGIGQGAGSVLQVRECTLRLMQWAKSKNVPVCIAGHVTKEGLVAGPKTLEHMVDVVLYLEGDPLGPYRLLRCVKNRFGSTNEVAVFEMRDKGLAEVHNPSELFLSQRGPLAPGSAVAPVVEGTRPLLVEVQALVTPATYGTPRRTANGLDFNRLITLCAVLSRRAGLALGSQDVIASVAGGLTVREPAADLAVALAIASSLRDLPVRRDLAAIGEVGLSGELRPVSLLERRLGEAAKLGFRQVLLPAAATIDPAACQGIEVLRAATVGDALRLALSRPLRAAPGPGPEAPPQVPATEQDTVKRGGS